MKEVRFSNVLNIPENHIKWMSTSRAKCLVPADWLQCAVERKLSSYSWQNELSSLECEQYLAFSKIKVPQPWRRITIKVILKSEETADGPSDAIDDACDECNSLSAHLSNVSKKSYQQQWSKAFYALHGNGTSKTHAKLQRSEVIHQCLERLFPEQMADLHNTSRDTNNTIRSNIVPVIKIFQSEKAFFVIQPLALYNIKNVTSYSPTIFKSSSIKPLFILYQLLKIFRELHTLGIPVGEISLKDILCDEKLWILISGVQFGKILPALQEKYGAFQNKNDYEKTDDNSSTSLKGLVDENQVIDSLAPELCLEDLCEESHAVVEARGFLLSDYQTKYSVHNLPILVDDWVHRRITNFKYLMVLNHLAGRRMCDPNHHPVLPWVLEFSSEDNSFLLRDLTKSKYRLNKGDSQLDLTYESFLTNIPHHVSDVLSDITYYVYKARRTPKTTLCSHVRPKWVPNEYPSSMARMYMWTPDECIPEFFTDPLIFTSIHDDLDDIELPVWAKTPEEFIAKHLEVLESDNVSESLNHWIDLTFGYKLSGSVAVKEKNINLQLVDEHKHVTNSGIVQLFTEPHPYRIPKQLMYQSEPPKIAKNVLWSQIHGVEESAVVGGKRIDAASQSSQRPEESTVILPKNYDPLASFNLIENLFNFTCQNMGQIPFASTDQVSPATLGCPAFVASDMQVFGCLTCELFLQPVVYSDVVDVPLDRRVLLICKRYAEEAACLPRSIDKVVEVLLNPRHCRESDSLKANNVSAFTSTNLLLPTPSQLLCPYDDILPFPDYFPTLYTCICKLKEIDRKLEKIEMDVLSSFHEKEKIMKVTAREKVTIMQKYLEKNSSLKLSEEGIEILLPHLEDLFSNENTSVQAAWSLFNLIGQQVDSDQMKTHFIPYLVKLYHVDNPTPKFMKIYHKSFIVQLVLRLGLEEFLSNFSTTLVEAVAGYKDYVFEDLYTETSEIDSMFEKSPVHLPIVIEEDRQSRTSSVLQDNGQSDEYDEMHVMPDDEDDIEVDLVVRKCSMPVGSGQEEKGSLHSFNGADDRKTEDNVSNHSLSSVIDSEADDENVLQFQYSEEVDQNEVSDGYTSDKSGDDVNGSGESDYEKRNTQHGHMTRSETDEFASTMSDKTASEVVNIRDVSMETIKWLSHRTGPLLTAKYLSRNLLRMLVLCYLGEEQLMSVDTKNDSLQTSRLVMGDRHAEKVISCLLYVAQLYGEQVLLIQYIPSIIDLVYGAKKRLTAKAEAGLVSSLVLLRHILPHLTDNTVMNILMDTIIKEILQPVIRVVSSPSHNFPSGSVMRTIICHKFVDAVYIIGLRIGFEMTRQHMTKLLQNFFVCFNPVNDMFKTEIPGSPQPIRTVLSNTSIDDTFCNIKLIDDSSKEYVFGTPVSVKNSISPQPSPFRRGQPHSLSTSAEDRDESFPENMHGKEDIEKEIADVFNPELAMASYIPFCRIFGSIHMEQYLSNDDYIRQLCAQFDNTEGEQVVDDIRETNQKGTDISNVELQGNKIYVQPTRDQSDLDLTSIGPIYKNSRILSMNPEATRSSDMERHRRRHLRGNWLAYWEHELGLSERDTLFNFKQIKLQAFEGHSAGIKTLTVFDNENSFISSSKDRTVKLWSVKSFGDGTGKSRPQWTYREHKKSVYSVVFLESLRLVTSCDSSVHIWDPFTTDTVRILDSSRYSPVTAMSSVATPSSMVLTANTENQLRFLDLRAVSYAHEYRCTTATAGLIRCLAVSPDSQWVAIGFSSGIMSLLSLKTGIMLGTWKAHEGEICQMKAYSNNKFISCSYDQTVKVWNADDIKDVTLLKGHTEPVHCISLYKKQVITGSTGNKIGVHSSADDQSMFTGEKLRSDTLRGVLTSMALFPLNKMLLLGADNGTVSLFC